MIRKLYAAAAAVLCLLAAALPAAAQQMSSPPFLGALRGNTLTQATPAGQTSAQLYTYDPSAIDINAGKFTFGLSVNTGANLPGSAHADTVWVMGYNVAPNGTRLSSAFPSLSFHWEDEYWQAGVAPAAMEFHTVFEDTSSGIHRIQSFFLPHNGGAGSIGIIGVDKFSFNDFSGAQKLVLDWAGQSISLNSQTAIQANWNNALLISQKNAAGNAFLPYPYLDSLNNMQSAEPIYVAAPTQANALGLRNATLTVSATSASAGDSVAVFKLAAVTGSGQIAEGTGSATGNLYNLLTNTQGTTGSAIYKLATSGGTGAMVSSYTNGTVSFSAGMDSAGVYRVRPALDSVASGNGLAVAQDGTVTVTNVNAQGLILSGVGLGLDNNKRIYGKTSGGAYTTMMLVDGSNNTTIRGAGTAITFQDINGSGLASFTEGGVYTFRNQTAANRITRVLVQEGADQASNEDLGVYASNGTTKRFSVDPNVVNLNEGQVVALRVVTASGTVTVAVTDYVVAIKKTTGAATTVNLPNGTTGQVFVIKDAKGDAATNNITVAPASGTIDGAASVTISANYGSLRLVYNGTEWNVI